MSSKRNVPAATIREWARTDKGAAALKAADAKFPGSRGRIDPSTKQVFHKENPRLVYVEKVAEAPTFDVAVVTLNKAGLKTTVKRSITNAQARTLLGQVGENSKGEAIMTRGRMNHNLLSLAASAVEAESLDFSGFQPA
jgi:hypothetical protein